MQSLVSYGWRAAKAGRNLVLNGHLDQFPAGDPEAWSFDPYSGECRDGRILGRGVGDMKAGSVASLLSLVLLHELDVPIRGQLTLTLVGDEETGGAWGLRVAAGARADDTRRRLPEQRAHRDGPSADRAQGQVHAAHRDPTRRRTGRGARSRTTP